jgi:hypothetical protein
VEERLSEKVTVTINGKSVRMTAEELAIFQLVKQAAEGKKDVFDYLLRLKGDAAVGCGGKKNDATDASESSGNENKLHDQVVDFFTRDLLQRVGIDADKVNNLLLGEETSGDDEEGAP